MIQKAKLFLPWLLCVLALPFCALLIRPHVELGIVDDWSYIRSAQILAETGHVVYNGWATAMLGWQLYFGALLIKLFGFSFTVPRMGTLLVAILTAGLMQRLCVRLGLASWNSTAVTLVLVLSPVFLAVTFTFMSDVYGMLVMIGCCYCCVRALQTANPQRAAAWVCTAALSNGIGGTARQIAWLGVLVLVPSTLWLLRKNRLALWLGGLSTLAGIAVIPLAMHWFNEQPYAVPESLRPAALPTAAYVVRHLSLIWVKGVFGELLLLSMPLLLVFLPSAFRNRRARILACFSLLALSAGLFQLHRMNHLSAWEPPYLLNNFWLRGFEYFPSYIGPAPLLLTPVVRLVLTLLLLSGGLGLVFALINGKRSSGSRSPLVSPTAVRGLSWPTACVLLLPCTLAYLLLLLPRLLAGGIFDRYLLFPEFVLLVFAVRIYQRNVQASLPKAVWLMILLLGVLDIAGMHDAFALFRAQASLLQEVASAGVSRTAIDGGSQFNGWTEVTTTGHLNDPRIVNPPHLYQPRPEISWDDRCRTAYLELTPSIQGRFVVSFDPTACGGPSRFAPVVFHTWFGPHLRTLYAVVGPYS